MLDRVVAEHLIPMMFELPLRTGALLPVLGLTVSAAFLGAGYGDRSTIDRARCMCCDSAPAQSGP